MENSSREICHKLKEKYVNEEEIIIIRCFICAKVGYEKLSFFFLILQYRETFIFTKNRRKTHMYGVEKKLILSILPETAIEAKIKLV